MLILEINREEVADLDDYTGILGGVGEDELVTFYVETPNGARSFVTFRVADDD